MARYPLSAQVRDICARYVETDASIEYLEDVVENGVRSLRRRPS